MSNFTVVINKDREYVDMQGFDEISQCTSFVNNCDYGNRFEIHKETCKNNLDYIVGSKKSNGHIDWERKKY